MPPEHAAAGGNSELLPSSLVDAGGNGHAGWEGNDGRTLLDATAAGRNDRVVSDLLLYGSRAELNMVSNSSGRAALYRSVAGGHQPVARGLILAGADVNHRQPVDNTCPINPVARHRRDDLVAELLADAQPSQLRCPKVAPGGRPSPLMVATA